MSLSAAVIDALLEAGATREQIAAAMKADIAERDAADAAHREARRVGNRERQRRYREAHNADNALHDVTGVNNGDTPAPDKSPPDPQKLTPTPGVCETRARAKFPTPEGVTDEQFSAFRQQRKKPLNERSYTLLCNKLRALAEDGWPPGEMIDLAIERGWETVFEPKDGKNGHRQSGTAVGLRGTRPDPALDLYREGIAEEAAERAAQATDRGAWTSLPALGSG